MGYTHHWEHLRPFSDAEWDAFVAGMATVIDESSELSPIEGTAAIVNEDFVAFVEQGRAESFIITKHPFTRQFMRTGKNFCKTAREDCDIPVTAILTYLETANFDLLRVTRTGGTEEEWTDGLLLARRAWPQCEHRLEYPKAAIYDRRPGVAVAG